MNLLSSFSKATWKRAQRRREFMTFGVMVFALELSVAIGVMAVKTELQAQTKNFENEIVPTGTSSNTEQQVSLNQKTKQLNGWLTILKRESVLDFPWPLMLSTIDHAAPGGVTFRSLNLSLASHQLTLNGHADTRDTLISFQQALSALPSLSKVNSPITNLLKHDNIDFSMTATFTTPTP